MWWERHSCAFLALAASGLLDAVTNTDYTVYDNEVLSIQGEVPDCTNNALTALILQATLCKKGRRNFPALHARAIAKGFALYSMSYPLSPPT